MAAKTLYYQVVGNVDRIYEVEKEILDDIYSKSYDEDAIFAIRLAMDEAIVNAIKHGHNNDESKEIKIEYIGDETKVCISIEDEGEGFDYNGIVDPRFEDALHRTHGRGIFLIQQFMSQVSFNPVGNRITFVYEKNKLPYVEDLGFKLWTTNGVSIVDLEDSFLENDVTLMQSKFKDLISHGHKFMIVDLKKLKRINTVLLNTFLLIHRMTENLGGKVIFVRPSPQVEKVITITNLNRVLILQSDLEEALAKLG